MEIGSHEELLRKTENMPDCTGHRQDGIKKNRSYISNFETVESNCQTPGIVFAKKLLSMLQLSSGALCGVETELTEAFTQFDELGVTEWKQQH